MESKSSLVLNLYSCAPYPVDNVVVVADIVLKVYHWFPRVMLSVDAAAGIFNVLVVCHSKRIPAHNV